MQPRIDNSIELSGAAWRQRRLKCKIFAFACQLKRQSLRTENFYSDSFRVRSQIDIVGSFGLKVPVVLSFFICLVDRRSLLQRDVDGRSVIRRVVSSLMAFGGCT